ncbi:MAG: hypothetical protein ACR2NG_04845, partial [Acidimicrobiia bacterium]
MNSDMTNEELSAALRDERAERESAQRRAAQLAENVALWRTRAEERSDRISRLEAERDQLRSARGWLRSKAGKVRTASTTPTSTAQTRPVPGSAVSGSTAYRAYVSTLVGAIGVQDPVMRDVLGQFNCVDFEDDPGILDRADLVVWDPSTGVGAPDLEERLDAWRRTGASSARVLLLAEPERPGASIAGHVVRADRQWLSSLDPKASDWVIPTTFNPATWNPSMRISRTDVEVLDPAMADRAIEEEVGVVIR